MQAMIECNAEVDARTLKGATPLLLAAASGLTNICDLLIRQNADMHAVNNQGKGALEVAKASSSDVKQRLLRWGCKPTRGTRRPAGTAGPPTQTKQARYMESSIDPASSWSRRQTVSDLNYDHQCQWGRW